MGIHHATIKKAEKMGIALKEDGDLVEAHWPEYNVRIIGRNASVALTEAQAAIAIKNVDPDIKFTATTVFDDGDDATLFWVTKGDQTWGDTPALLSYIHAQMMKGDDDWQDEPEDVDIDVPVDPVDGINIEIARNEKGIPLRGEIAYAEGFAAADNPFLVEDGEEETDEIREAMEAWDEAWDAAADEAEESEGGEGGSVVSSKYRAKYSEAGHPTHCGDWLAETLNNLCQHSKGTDLDRFEAICTANGVDLSKYNRETRGWEGRLRMTGRNLLAKKVYLAEGILLTPIEGAEPQYKAPAEWMQMQRYKMPKKDQAKPIPGTETKPE